jgi:hypothetical protein
VGIAEIGIVAFDDIPPALSAVALVQLCPVAKRFACQTLEAAIRD